VVQLPLREMVLYKNGVGFFVREGAVDVPSITLTFRQDAVNDILKSLAIFDKAGGQVLGIHYQTPMDKADRLAGSSIKLSDYGSLRDLLRDLRGRQVALTFETSADILQTIEGRVVGIDQPVVNNQQVYLGADPNNAAAVMVLTQENRLEVHRLNALRAVQINDQQSESDLGQLLDASMAEEGRRNITIQLSEGEHQLVVHYVAPNSPWRVSYRVVAEAGSNADNGTAYLQGWGLFDNRLEEDLENVKVTLVVGQPISFVYDLYGSYIPARTTVSDDVRVAPGPVEYEYASFSDDTIIAGMEPMRRKAMEVAKAAPKFGKAPKGTVVGRAAPREYLPQRVPAAAKAKEAGESFHYAVTTPVSVKQGDSALVPIVGAEIAYQRELLYNAAKLADHPAVAVRFLNTTGLILERGPVTIVEDEVYKGEAVLPLTKQDNQIYLPYAVELGITIVERTEYATITVGFRIVDRCLVFESFHEQKTTYVLQNSTTKPQTVFIEAPIQTGYDLHKTRTADVDTLSERRWRVPIAAQGKAEFIRTERKCIQRILLGFPSRTSTHQ
jgi:hypothetical protein